MSANSLVFSSSRGESPCLCPLTLDEFCYCLANRIQWKWWCVSFWGQALKNRQHLLSSLKKTSSWHPVAMLRGSPSSLVERPHGRGTKVPNCQPWASSQPEDSPNWPVMQVSHLEVNTPAPLMLCGAKMSCSHQVLPICWFLREKNACCSLKPLSFGVLYYTTIEWNRGCI